MAGLESAEANASAAASPDAGDVELVDTEHLGHPHLIGAWFAGDVLVDPGPSTSLDRVLEAIERRRPRAVALTHIHLDHAGATGSVLRLFPELEVWVHERGAQHMIDPTKLLASAGRLYGDEMQRLWGEVLPVPAERVRALRGGERLADLRVAYTPGHASHHVAYLHEPSGWAFTGDAAGVRIGEGPVLAPTPPPDVDLEAWAESLDTLAAWSPRRLAVTHFGSYADVDAHLDALREQLVLARSDGRLDEAAFRAVRRERVAAIADDVTAAAYERAMPPMHSHRGLVRYLQKQR
jgi:glyoxylase-like metal-dependent hydrolase (beta-lactamase superfamily II)